MRVFLDANVLFSASKAASAISKMVELALEKNNLVTSDLALHEARTNLRLKRPSWVSGFERLLATIDTVPTTVFALPVTLDEKDVPLLCAAVHASCDYFVTGDRKDFGHLFGETVLGVKIVTPLVLAETLTR